MGGSGFLPRFSTIGEFFANLFVYSGKIEIDKISRQVLLHEAYLQSDSEAKLGFEREFLRFLSTSDFLDKFFSEINGGLVELDEIDQSDTYAEFADHLKILQNISSNYKRLLSKNGFYDPKYEAPSDINQLYLALFDSIDVYLEGYPTNLELVTLSKIAEKKQVKLFMYKNRFSDKLLDRVSSIGVDIVNIADGFYEINLSTKTFVQLDSDSKNINLQLGLFSERIYQAAFVFYMIEHYRSIGVKEEDICVVLPDESFVLLLESLDKMNNLNFAMGKKIKYKEFASKLIAIRDFVCASSDVASAKLRHYGCFELANEFTTLELLLEGLGYKNEPDIAEMVDEELYNLSKAAWSYGNDQKTALWLFSEALLGRSIDHVGGGKITVMGTLETRGCHFDGVIVVDFNEQKVPKPEEKDLFLNAKIRSRCALPTTSDREDLQSYYYHRLFENAKYVAVCAVKNERENPAGVLRFFDTTISPFGDDEAILVLGKLLQTREKIETKPNPDTNNYKIQNLSATALKDLLECKKRYYFKYIKRLSEQAETDKLKSSEMGLLFHATAAKILAPNNSYGDKNEIVEAFESEFTKAIAASQFPEYAFEAKLLLSKLDDFFDCELDRAREVTVELVEQDFRFTLHDIEFRGKIDRVDMDKNGLYYILDYKLKESIGVDTLKKITQKPDDIVDFQLPIYVYGCASILNMPVDDFVTRHFGGAGYYDVYNAKILTEEGLLAKMALLEERVAEIAKIEMPASWFHECEKVSLCRFCAYSEVCSGERSK